MTLDSRTLYADFVAELEAASGLSTGYRRQGALHVALDRDEAAELQRVHELQRSLGLEAEWLSPRALPRARARAQSVAARRCLRAGRGGGRSPAAGRGAPGGACRRGGRRPHRCPRSPRPCFEGERIAGVRDRRTARSCAPPRRARRRRVVGPGRLAPASTRGRRCARSRARSSSCARVDGRAALRAHHRAPSASTWCRAPTAAWSSARPWRSRASTPAVTAGAVHELLREAYRLLPEIAELELVEAAAGLRPGTPDNLPLIGPRRARRACSGPPATGATASCWRR